MERDENSENIPSSPSYSSPVNPISSKKEFKLEIDTSMLKRIGSGKVERITGTESVDSFDSFNIDPISPKKDTPKILDDNDGAFEVFKKLDRIEKLILQQTIVIYEVSTHFNDIESIYITKKVQKKIGKIREREKTLTLDVNSFEYCKNSNKLNLKPGMILTIYDDRHGMDSKILYEQCCYFDPKDNVVLDNAKNDVIEQIQIGFYRKNEFWVGKKDVSKLVVCIATFGQLLKHIKLGDLNILNGVLEIEKEFGRCASRKDEMTMICRRGRKRFFMSSLKNFQIHTFCCNDDNIDDVFCKINHNVNVLHDHRRFTKGSKTKKKDVEE